MGLGCWLVWLFGEPARLMGLWPIMWLRCLFQSSCWHRQAKFRKQQQENAGSRHYITGSRQKKESPCRKHGNLKITWRFLCAAGSQRSTIFSMIAALWASHLCTYVAATGDKTQAAQQHSSDFYLKITNKSLIHKLNMASPFMLLCLLCNFVVFPLIRQITCQRPHLHKTRSNKKKHSGTTATRNLNGRQEGTVCFDSERRLTPRVWGWLKVQVQDALRSLRCLLIP